MRRRWLARFLNAEFLLVAIVFMLIVAVTDGPPWEWPQYAYVFIVFFYILYAFPVFLLMAIFTSIWVYRDPRCATPGEANLNRPSRTWLLPLSYIVFMVICFFFFASKEGFAP